LANHDFLYLFYNYVGYGKLTTIYNLLIWGVGDANPDNINFEDGMPAISMGMSTMLGSKLEIESTSR
jgi:hypothetical protein